MATINKLQKVRQQLQYEYGDFLKNWPNYNKNYDLDNKYKENYKLICDRMKNVQGYNDNDRELCPIFFGFLENINRGGKDIFTNHEIWSDFIEWSYQKQTDPNVFTNWNLDKFVSLIESLIKANVQPILNDAEVLNKDNVKLRNVMKLYYFWENLGDITARFNANHDESYVPYCHFINDCLDIFNVYYPEVCSAHWPEETKPKNICKLFEDIKDGYKNRLYPYIERRKALIKGYGDGIFEYRLQCKFNQREYGSRPIESFFAQPNSGFLTGFNKLIVSSFSMLGVLMFFFLLYKLTPINRLFGSKEAERTRRWRSSVYQRTGEYTDYYGDQLDSVFGTEYGSESGTNFGSESVSNFGTETGTNFGSESVSDFGTETGTNFGSESVSDFGTERGSSYGRRQGSSYGGYYGDDNSSYMS